MRSHRPKFLCPKEYFSSPGKIEDQKKVLQVTKAIKKLFFLSSVIVRVFTFYFFNLFYVLCFLMWGDIKWCSRPIPLLFYGLGLSYRCLFLSKSCSYAFNPDALFACQTGPPQEVECRDSLTLHSRKRFLGDFVYRA